MTEEEYQKFDEFLNTTRFDVRELMATKKRFEEVFNTLYDFMKMGFEEERVRKHPLYYSFHGTNDTVLEMQVRHFIVNMLFWYPMMKMHLADKLDESFIFDCTCPSRSDMMQYFNYKIIEPYRDRVSNEKMNLIFSDTLYRLGQISLDFNEIMAVSISIQTFMHLADEDGDFRDLREVYYHISEEEDKKYDAMRHEFNELIHTKLDPTLQPKEVENELHKRQKRLIELMKTIPNDLQPILNSGEGVKHKQLAELVIAGGLKPDMVGNTIPVPIDSNFLVDGINSVKNFYIDKQAGRKAVVANKTLMGNAGYFSTKIKKVTKDTRVDFSVFDCGTQHPIHYFVKDYSHLVIINRSYYALEEDPLNYKVVDARKDHHLIGKMILLRSPATCGLKHNKVCLMCYGEMSKINDGPDFNHGSFAAAISSNKQQQDMLSTKHLQTTNSVWIEFPEIFYTIFTLEASILAIHPEKIDDLKRWSIIVENKKLVEFDQVEFNSHTSQIILRDNYSKEEHIIEEKNGSEIFLYQDAIELFHTIPDGMILPLEELDDSLMLGMIMVENNELTKPLKNMQLLLDNNNHFGCTTIDEAVNTLADLMIQAEMNVLLVHGCMTLKNLIRLKDDIYQFPNFSSFKEQEYVMLKITDALVHNPSLSTSLSSQDLRKQLADPATYRKHAKASTDVQFRKSLV